VAPGMKILEVTNLFSPVHGGSAEVPYQLSSELARRGHQVTVYTSDFKVGGVIDVPGVTVHAFRTWLDLSRLYLTPGIFGTASQEIKGFDIIHMHNYRTFQNMAVAHYARKGGVPYVLQAHGSLPTTNSKQRLKQLYDKAWGYRLLRDTARVIAVTAVEAGQYRNMGVGEDRIETIPHGINLAEFDSLPERGVFRREHGLDGNQRIILYLGRLHRIKGLDLLIQAFTGLSQQVGDARLVIAGPDDGYLRKLNRLISESGVAEKVLLTGPLYGPDKLKAYVDADVYVLPSVYEIFGITVLEACACGTPVVVTDRCGLAGVIDGRVGLAVPYDAGRLQEALQRLLNDAGV
jgi:glycosyltransferase involved in cell wall biosynthesis